MKKILRKINKEKIDLRAKMHAQKSVNKHLKVKNNYKFEKGPINVHKQNRGNIDKSDIFTLTITVTNGGKRNE